MFRKINYKFIIYFANSIWIHYHFWEFYMNTLFFTRSHYEFIFFIAYWVQIHVMFREFTIDFANVPLSSKNSLSSRIHYHYLFWLWIYYLFRKFTFLFANSLSFSRLNYKFTFFFKEFTIYFANQVRILVVVSRIFYKFTLFFANILRIHYFLLGIHYEITIPLVVSLYRFEFIICSANLI